MAQMEQNGSDAGRILTLDEARARLFQLDDMKVVSHGDAPAATEQVTIPGEKISEVQYPQKPHSTGAEEYTAMLEHAHQIVQNAASTSVADTLMTAHIHTAPTPKDMAATLNYASLQEDKVSPKDMPNRTPKEQAAADPFLTPEAEAALNRLLSVLDSTTPPPRKPRTARTAQTAVPQTESLPAPQEITTEVAEALPNPVVQPKEPVRKGISHKRDAIADLVSLDTSGRVRYENAVDGNGRHINGRFMSKYELEVIEANQDFIRDGLADRNEPAPEPEVVTEKADQPLVEAVATHADTPGAVIDNEVMPQGASLEEIDDLERPATLDEITWQQLNPEEKLRAIYFTLNEQTTSPDETLYTNEDWATLSLEEKRRGALAIARIHHETAAPAVEEPQVEPQIAEEPKKSHWTKRALRLLGIDHAKENGTRTIAVKRRRLAGAAGAILAVSAALTGVATHESTATARAAVVEQPAAQSAVQPRVIAQPVRKPAPKAQVRPETYTAKNGDSPWHVAKLLLQQRGISDPTNLQIDTLDDQLRAVNNHMTEEQATHVPVGYKYKLPPQKHA